MANNLKNLRAFARGAISESALQEMNDANEPFDLEDEEFMAECVAAATPLYIQYEILGESADAMDEAAVETFSRLQNYMVGQGLISEAAVSITNPKINIVHLNKQAQINRLTKIITLKLARKAGSKNYKKYKLGLQIKKVNMEAMTKSYGQKASRLAKQAWSKLQKQPKVNAVISDKKKKK